MMGMLRLTGTTTRGDLHPVLVALSDISSVKPIGAQSKGGAMSVISLKSNPDFAVWVTQDFAEIETALMHLGVDIATRGGRNG